MWAIFKKQPPIRSLIGEGTVVHGEVRFGDGLRIDGEVHGDVVAVGDGRSILVISGTVIGPVQADELLELQPKARIAGDVRYETLEMHQGATIDGEVRALKTLDERPALKLAASSKH
jgi:cytoskeletal protein CcmA (bactofilin family)